MRYDSKSRAATKRKLLATGQTQVADVQLISVKFIPFVNIMPYPRNGVRF